MSGEERADLARRLAYGTAYSYDEIYLALNAVFDAGLAPSDNTVADWLVHGGPLFLYSIASLAKAEW